jgi:hypothetical protein
MVNDLNILMSSSAGAEKWFSDPVGMLRVHQAQTYKLGQCIADLVDNSYDANATIIEIWLETNSDGEMYLLIFDNGKGIPEEKWRDAMTLGLQRARNDEDLGVYGVGMKLSSLSQANEVTVASVHNGKYGLRRISAKHIIETQRNEILTNSTNSAISKEAYNQMIDEDWSTMVLLEDMERAKGRILSMDSDSTVSLNKEIKRIEAHLGLTFERVLNSKHRGHVKLKFNGRQVKPINPFMEWEDDPRYGVVTIPSTPISFDSEKGKVTARVKPYIIPHTKKFGDSRRCRRVNSGYWKANHMQGFYIYRNDRLIQYGDWSVMLGTMDEHNKLSKVAIEIPPGTEAIFGLSPTKIEIQMPVEFLRRVRDYLDTPRQWGQINRGKKISFLGASDHRYRTEGKVAKKKPAKKKTEEATTTEFNPDLKPKKKKAVKPNPGVVKSYQDDGKFTTVVIDNKADKASELLEQIRRWQI